MELLPIQKFVAQRLHTSGLTRVPSSGWQHTSQQQCLIHHTTEDSVTESSSQKRGVEVEVGGTCMEICISLVNRNTSLISVSDFLFTYTSGSTWNWRETISWNMPEVKCIISWSRWLGIQDLTVFCCDFTLQEAHSLQNGGKRSPSVLFWCGNQQRTR